jgi:hypothetical protein
MYLSTNVVTNFAATAAAVATTNTIVHSVNWTIIGGIAATVIPILIAAVAVILKLYGERTRIAESALRESPVIQNLQQTINTEIGNAQDNMERNIANITQRINEHITQISENIREVNHSRDTLRSETSRTFEIQRQNVDELRTLVFSMRSDLEIFRVENEHQNRSIEELKTDNRELVARLENLVKELYEYLNASS